MGGSALADPGRYAHCVCGQVQFRSEPQVPMLLLKPDAPINWVLVCTDCGKRYVPVLGMLLPASSPGEMLEEHRRAGLLATPSVKEP